MTALQIIKAKREIIYVSHWVGGKAVSTKGTPVVYKTSELLRNAIREQNKRHLAMVRRGRK